MTIIYGLIILLMYKIQHKLFLIDQWSHIQIKEYYNMFQQLYLSDIKNNKNIKIHNIFLNNVTCLVLK